MASKIINISDYYKPFPKQQLFHGSNAKNRLFGGAAGPGKSFALLWEAILHNLDYPGCNTLLLRRTYRQLEMGLIDHFRKYIPPEIYGGARNYNSSNHAVRFPNGSNLFFGHLQHDKDVLGYHGGEFLFIGWDELTEFTYDQWEYLSTRNRCPIAGTHPNMAGATNPGEIGHAWVKALWIDKKPAPGMPASSYDPNDFDFIPALVTDNPIYANDKSYMETLNKLKPQLKRAMLEGKWDVFASQYYDNFDRAKTVATPGDIFNIIQPWWTKWISIDWGYEHHCAVFWHARGEHKGVDTVITYKELVFNHLDEPDIAELIANTCTEEERKTMGPIFLSPDAFARRRANYTNSVADRIGEGLFKRGLSRPRLADDDRVGGWRLMYNLLESGEWLISEDCDQLIDALPILIRDKAKREDVLKQPTIADDVADGCRYGLKSMLQSREMPRELQRAQTLQTVVQKNPELPQDQVHTKQHMASMAFDKKWNKDHQPLKRVPRRRR